MSPPPEAADQVGAATLERMAAAPRYNRWMFDRLRPWVGRRVLEIGAGIGNMSAFFADRERVVLTDKLRTAGFRLRHLEYFNLAGVPGWWVAGRVLRRRLIPTGALRCYETLVPLFRLERLLPWRIGQSLIAVGEVSA